MADQSRDNERSKSTNRTKKRLWLIISFVFAVITCLLFCKVLYHQSVDERLTKIEAARAIPDSENAAILYYQLLDEYATCSLSSLDLDPSDVTFAGPWSSGDYPELAKWFEEKQHIIDRLLELSEFEKCCFPIPNPSAGESINTSYLKIVRQWAFFLVRSANNDIAEGRLDEALEKLICIIRMGSHNRQQPLAVYFLTSISLEAVGAQRIRYIIMHDDVTEEHLQVIETALQQLNIDRNKAFEKMLKVENLYSRLSPGITGFFQRLKAWWQGDTLDKKISEISSRLLMDSRGSLILVALRQYKNNTGHWPESLDEIQPLVSEDILIDPQNNDSFVYKLSGNIFILYSKGLNNIDQNGQKGKGADDRLIWPLIGKRTKQEDVNGT